MLIAQYFLNHRLETKEIEWQVKEIAEQGYDGIYAHARQGLLTPYFSENWWQIIQLLLSLCKKYNLEFWIWDEDYFPSGLAGGRITWENPDLAYKSLEFASQVVEGAGPHEVDFQCPGMLLRCFAIEMKNDNTYGEIRDVTAYCGTRRQRWGARWMQHSAYSPAINKIGHPHWRCEMDENRFCLAWQPEQKGKYLILAALVQHHADDAHPDILRPEGIQRFIELTHEEYYRRFGTTCSDWIKGAFTDEPSPYAFFPWTPKFAQEFEKDHHYDILPQLAHLAVNLNGTSAIVRHHYRQTQHRLQYTNYLLPIREWCQSHGMEFAGHLTRTEWLTLTSSWWPDELRMYKAMDIPACDPLGAQTGIPEGAAYHNGIKVVSSAAHLFSKKYAASDCLAVLGDNSPIRLLKSLLDYQIALGINYFSIHGISYSMDGPRKDEVPPSIFYQHTEWKYMHVLTDYLKETCSQLTQGEHCCDILMLYPSTSLGCQIDAKTGWSLLADEEKIHGVAEKLLSHQCDFDWIDEVTFCEMVGTGKNWSLPDKYRMILLPYIRYIDHRVLDALKVFAKNKGRVILIGAKPVVLTSRPEKAIQDLTLPKVEYHESIESEFFHLISSMKIEGNYPRDVFIHHRKMPNRDVVFAYNRNEESFEGKIGDTEVRITPQGSLMLVDGRVQEAIEYSNENKLVADLSCGWDITFERNHVPMNYWHVYSGQGWGDNGTIWELPAFDLMRREQEPTGKEADRTCYYARFMVTGEIPDTMLVMEGSTIEGNWKLYVNDHQITDWKQSKVYDCCNIQAPIGHALRGNTTPALNIIKIETTGKVRGLKEMLYLYGSFGCEYRYEHLSFPFLKGFTKSAVHLDILQAWNMIGYPTYSGTASYYRKIIFEKNGDYLLDLGRVEDIAEILIDDISCKVICWPPYRVVLKNVTAGSHRLTVKVTNSPANRNRAANIASGLIGPVKLFCIG
jgi:hypothetical protein